RSIRLNHTRAIGPLSRVLHPRARLSRNCRPATGIAHLVAIASQSEAATPRNALRVSLHLALRGKHARPCSVLMPRIHSNAPDRFDSVNGVNPSGRRSIVMSTQPEQRAWTRRDVLAMGWATAGALTFGAGVP